MKYTTMAYSAAMTKAIEALFPPGKRLFEDSYSFQILTPPYRMLVNMMKFKPLFYWLMNLRERMTPGVVASLLCRVRYIDEVLSTAIRGGFETLVNLGSGFDSRSLRIPGIEALKVFEIDHPAVMEEKRKRLIKTNLGVPPHLFLVPIDFNTMSLKQGLENAGYDPAMKTLYLWEGVTQYISPEAIESTLGYVAQSAPGNRVVFTYVLKQFVDTPESFTELKGLVKQFNMMGVQFRSGLEPEKLADYLDRLGLKLLKDIGSDFYVEQYLKPLKRTPAATKIERIALAETKA